ncbi:MAG: cytochrome c biogenesis protein ResB [Dehalococcoidia bacterium]|nr:cytochrome c biogenesis protein ResB [Dehalococcoidia bacterium]
MARAETARTEVRTVRSAELLLWLWRLLASAQFAIALIGFLALVGLVAVVLPQVPAAMQGNAAALDAWLETRKDSFGPFTEPMLRVGLFTIVTSWWFLTALGLLALSICVYTVDRFVAIWRNVTRPREEVADSFFERAANRAVLELPAAGPGEAASLRLEGVLRARRFRVRRLAVGETAYLFADRFAWAQLGSFVTHLALVLLLVGGLVSRLGGFTSALLVAEGTASPVFPVSDPNQMQVEVVDAVATFNESGQPTDYRSELVIYQGGEEVARGATTVNDPLSYRGYRFHQAGYLGEGAALRVRDLASGNTSYREVLALDELQPAPAVTVRDESDRVLLDDVIVPTDFIQGTSGTLVTVPETGRQFWVGIAQDEDDAWDLVVYERDESDARFIVPAGETQRAEGLAWTFNETAGLPSLVAPGLPGDSERSSVVLSETPEGTPYLTILGAVDGRALTLYPEQPERIGDLEYAFEGRREFAGIEVRKDPGANLIWAGAGLLIAGLMVTFYVPRLRLWARVRGDETVLASTGERRGVFQAEAKQLMKQLGARTGTQEGEGADA